MSAKVLGCWNSWFWIIEGAKHLLVGPRFSKVSISCFISINLNLEKPFFAVLREFSRVFTRCWNFLRVFGKFGVGKVNYWGC